MAYQPISLTNYSSQLAEVERQKRMAQALQEQANAPIEIQSYKGTQAPIPWTSILAKGLAAVGANLKEGRAAKRAAQLEQFKNEQTQQAIKNLLSPVSTAAVPTLPQGPTLTAALNAPTAAGMTPTAGAGGMPTAPNQALAAALSGQRMNAGAGNPMVAGASPVQPPIAPMPSAVGAMKPIAVPPTAGVRAANSQELQQRSIEALGSPFENVRALGLNALERSQTMEDEQRKRTQAREDEAYKLQTTADFLRQSEIRDVADLTSAIEASDLSDEQKTKYRSLAPIVGKDGLVKVIQEDAKPSKGILGEYADALATGLVPPGTSFAQFNDMKKGAIRTVAPGASIVELGGGAAAPGAFGKAIESAVSGSIPGATVTSRQRSPDKNAAVGGVPNSFHLSDNARDFVPPQGMTTAQMAERLKAQMPGYDVVDERTHVHVEPGPNMATSGKPRELYRAPFRPSSTMVPVDSKNLEKAVKEGRAPPSALISRNRAGFAEFYNQYPDADTVKNQAAYNTAISVIDQRNARQLNEIPEIISGVVDAGKKLNYSDLKYAAEAQRWMKDQTTSPEFVEYMTRRNEAILAVARAFRGGVATEFASKLEEQASRPTLSPKGLDGWMRGQLGSLLPKLEQNIPRDKTGESQRQYDAAVNLLVSLGGKVPSKAGGEVKGASAYNDPAKEARYQAWKARQGK